VTIDAILPTAAHAPKPDVRTAVGYTSGVYKSTKNNIDQQSIQLIFLLTVEFSHMQLRMQLKLQLVQYMTSQLIQTSVHLESTTKIDKLQKLLVKKQKNTKISIVFVYLHTTLMCQLASSFFQLVEPTMQQQ
jgi:hypothetical protein